MALVVDRVSPPSHSSEREDKSKVSQSTYIWLHRVVTGGYPGRTSRRKGERAEHQTREKQGQTKRAYPVIWLQSWVF